MAEPWKQAVSEGPEMTIQGILGGSAASLVGSVQSAAPSVSAAVTASASGGGVSLSGVGQFLSKLQELEKSDPTKAKQVLTDIAGRLKADAGQATGTQADRLNQLADKFQKAADTGDLSALPAAGAPAVQGGQGHHHGHHKAQQAYQSGQGDSLLEMMNSVLAADTGKATTNSASTASSGS